MRKVHWMPVVVEELMAVIEGRNEHDKHAVDMMRDGYIDGHMPHSLSKISWFFLKHGGRITCHSTVKRKFGIGLDLLCIFTFCPC